MTSDTTTATDAYVKYAVEGAFATLTLDSPHNRNAISTRLVTELTAGLEAAANDPQVRAVVLTHTGGTFCAGADLSEASGANGDAPTDPATAAGQRTRQMGELLRAIVALPKPVIGQIDGHVRAGGMGLVGACDIVVAGPKCTFALTEAKLGLAASIISITLLPRLTSRAAARYFLTGEKFGPEEAERIGLVTLVSDSPAERVAELLGELRAASPQGLAETKALTSAEMLEHFDKYAEKRAEQSARLFTSAEAREGMMAFLQRRTPRWAQ
jgi:enoyl-CoA hydratase